MIKELGQGAYGIVYLVHENSSQNLFAMKTFPHDNKSRILKEYKLMTTLKHPNIVTCYDLKDFKGNGAIILEFCEMGDLKSYWKSKDPKVHEKEISMYCGQILDGLVYLHSEGILHMDLKSENILLTKGKLKKTIAKIADFGCAVALKDLKDPKQISGTARFMSPEIFETWFGLHSDKNLIPKSFYDIGVSSDIWS